MKLISEKINEYVYSINRNDSLSTEDKHEMKQAMEEEYGIHVFNNWNSVKHILLLYIKLHLTILGAVIAIFARDEYQGKVGNLCHNYLIAAINFNDEAIQNSAMTIPWSFMILIQLHLQND